MGKKNIGRKTKTAKPSRSVASPKAAKGFSLSGETLANVITSPVVRELAADVLIAIAGAITANRAGNTAAARASSTNSDATRAARTATGAVAGVMVEAARRILPSATDGPTEDGGRESAPPRNGSRPAIAAPKRKRKPRAESPRER